VNPLTGKPGQARRHANPVVIEALRASANIISVAAQKLGVNRSTLYDWINDDPELQEARRQVKEEILDLAESKALEAIRAGSERVVTWFLEMQGKERGYVRRQEASGPGGGPIPVKTESEYKGQPKADLKAQAEVLLKAAEAIAAAEAA
jgi:hypothetical protein